MIRALIALLVLAGAGSAGAQVKVEYDKGTDFSKYKTFRFGEGEIITPKDRREIEDATLHSWIKSAIRQELTGKGLHAVDSNADLTISYISGALQFSSAGSVGPLGISPTNQNQTYMQDYRQGSLVIDLNDAQTSRLVWRVKATTNTAEAQGSIDRAVGQGFKKFSIHPRKQKEKKKRS